MRGVYRYVGESVIRKEERFFFGRGVDLVRVLVCRRGLMCVIA